MSDSVFCSNCDTIYPLKEYVWELVPGRGKFVVIKAYNSNSVSTKSYSIKYPVVYTPDPSVYIGKTISGTKLKTIDSTISVGYRGEFSVNAQFEILSWSLDFGKESINGNGSYLNQEAIVFIESLEESQLFSLILKIRDNLGLVRTISGVFFR